MTSVRRQAIGPALILALYGFLPATEAGEPNVPRLLNQPKVAVTVEDHAVTVTFGPIDLAETPGGHTLAPMPKDIFQIPKDLAVVAFKAAVFTKDGTALPRHYLHHLSILDLDRPSTFCPGAPYLIGGSGMEMTEVRFPTGYGIRLAQGTKLLAVASFYHRVQPTKGVMARFTMELASEGTPVLPMEAYHVSATADCYSKLVQPTNDETEEGVVLRAGTQIRSAPVNFREEGCVKFAHAHGHDQLALIVLDNKTARRTLLRTLPNVAPDGTFLGFPPHQVYSDARGFPVNPRDEYEITMVYHRPLHDEGPRYGMASYLLYMTPGDCSKGTVNHLAPSLRASE